MSNTGEMWAMGQISQVLHGSAAVLVAASKPRKPAKVAA